MCIQFSGFKFVRFRVCCIWLNFLAVWIVLTHRCRRACRPLVAALSAAGGTLKKFRADVNFLYITYLSLTANLELDVLFARVLGWMCAVGLCPSV